MNDGLLTNWPSTRQKLYFLFGAVIVWGLTVVPPEGQITGAQVATQIKTAMTAAVLIYPPAILAYKGESPIVALLVTYVYYLIAVIGTNSFYTVSNPSTTYDLVLYFLLLTVPTPTVITCVSYSVSYLIFMKTLQNINIV